MKSVIIGASLASMALAEEVEANPVRKIITLLQKMQEKTEEEGRSEEALFKKFDCHCKKHKEEIGSNGEALQRKMDDMKAAIQEHSAANEQFKQQVAEAKRERETAQASLAQATSVRNKRHEEWTLENESGNTDVAAMQKAIAILEGKSSQEELLQAVSDSRLKKVVLTVQGISTFERSTVSSFLAGSTDVGRGEVLGILKQMSDTMAADLKSANDDETAQAASFEELKKAKLSEIASLTKSIESGQERAGEEAFAAATTTTELTDAQNSFGADVDFMQRLEENCATKTKEYGERTAMREQELTAITEVIGMLNNDDSLMTFHTAKQHVSLLQKDMTSAKNDAYAVVRDLANTPRFSFLSYMVRHAAGKFDSVLQIIADMIALLDQEQIDDDNHRDYCTDELHQNELEKSQTKNKIDGHNAKIDDISANIEAGKADAADKDRVIAELDESVASATEDRKSEHEAFLVLVKDTDAALVLLEKAKNRLNKFYNPNLYNEAPKEELSDEDKIMQASMPNFLQRALMKIRAPVREAAPETWSGEYKNKQQGGSGVVALMDTILHELAETKTVATTDEQHAQTDYEGFMQACADNRDKTVLALAHINDSLYQNEENLSNENGNLNSKRQTLGEIIEETADLHGECDFLLENFEYRNDARATEREGLVSAQAALNGADLGDSFLQQGPAQEETSAAATPIRPFGDEDTGSMMTENAAATQKTLVDAVENAEVAEMKRAVFRSLTRLRAATIKEFDSMARRETQVFDAYNDAQNQAENPITSLGSSDPPLDADVQASFHP